MARKPLRRSDLLSRLRKARRARPNPVDQLLLVNPARHKKVRRGWTDKKLAAARRAALAARGYKFTARRRATAMQNIKKAQKRIHVKRGRPKSNPRKRHMAKWKWTPGRRRAFKKMRAALRHGRPNPKHKRGGRRKRRMTAKALAAARRNLHLARAARGGGKRHRRRRYRKNPLTSGQKAAIGRMSKSLRRRLRKAHRALRRRHGKRKGGTVAKRAKRRGKKKYVFTAKRRRAAKRNLAKARAGRRGRGRKGGHKKGRSRRRRSMMRVIRSRRGRPGRRGRRTGLTTLRRARRYLRGRRKVGRLAKAFARRWRMRSNPGLGGLTRSIVPLAINGAWALGGLIGTGVIGGLVRATPLQGLLGVAGERHVAWVTSLVAALGLLWLTSRVGFLRRRQTPIMIGAGLGVVQNVLAAFAPGVLSLGSGGGMSGTYVEDSAPLADYIVDGTSMGDYVPELGADVEQALAGYVVEGPIGQAVAGLSGPRETALARSRGAAWTATGPIPPRPGAYMGAGYMGIFNNNIFG